MARRAGPYRRNKPCLCISTRKLRPLWADSIVRIVARTYTYCTYAVPHCPCTMAPHQIAPHQTAPHQTADCCRPAVCPSFALTVQRCRGRIFIHRGGCQSTYRHRSYNRSGLTPLPPPPVPPPTTHNRHLTRFSTLAPAQVGSTTSVTAASSAVLNPGVATPNGVAWKNIEVAVGSADSSPD